MIYIGGGRSVEVVGKRGFTVYLHPIRVTPSVSGYIQSTLVKPENFTPSTLHRTSEVTGYIILKSKCRA